MEKLILFVLAVMILYDLSLHIFDSLRDFGKTKLKHPFGVWILLDHFAKDNVQKRRKIYDIFWLLYWGIAGILIVVYLLRGK